MQARPAHDPDLTRPGPYALTQTGPARSNSHPQVRALAGNRVPRVVPHSSPPSMALARLHA